MRDWIKAFVKTLGVFGVVGLLVLFLFLTPPEILGMVFITVVILFVFVMIMALFKSAQDSKRMRAEHMARREARYANRVPPKPPTGRAGSR